MAGVRSRADAGEYAGRVNAAADLLASGGAVAEAAFVFERHAATDVSVAYAILVPQRRARMRAGQEGRPQHDQRGDLRPGVLGPAEEGRDDRLADGGAARARRAVGA